MFIGVYIKTLFVRYFFHMFLYIIKTSLINRPQYKLRENKSVLNDFSTPLFIHRPCAPTRSTFVPAKNLLWGFDLRPNEIH